MSEIEEDAIFIRPPRDWSSWGQSNLGGAFLFGSSLGLVQAYYKHLPPSAGKEPFQNGIPYARFSIQMLKQGTMFSLLSIIYTSGTYLSSQIRGKDDAVNHGIGGALLGSFVGLQKGSIHRAFLSSAGFGLAAIVTSHGYNTLKDTRELDVSKYYGLKKYFERVFAK